MTVGVSQKTEPEVDYVILLTTEGWKEVDSNPHFSTKLYFLGLNLNFNVSRTKPTGPGHVIVLQCFVSIML